MLSYMCILCRVPVEVFDDGLNKNRIHRQTLDKKYVWLPRRSLLVLQGDARYTWSHGISPRKFDKVQGELIARQRRVSFTFRQVALIAIFTRD